MDRQEVHLTRKIEVSSAHSYTLDALSSAEREATFGKSAATHAHGSTSALICSRQVLPK